MKVTSPVPGEHCIRSLTAQIAALPLPFQDGVGGHFMISSNERKRIKAQVEFTRSGWRQLARLNRSLGARLIRAFVLCHELSAYLAEHEASGVHLDTECQEVRYVDGVYLLLRRSQDIWYITDVFAAEEGDGYEPMYFWQRVRRGAGCVLIRLLIGWRQLTRRAVACA